MEMFRVTWEIDEEAETPEDAARQALARVSNPDGITHIFTVTPFVAHPMIHAPGRSVTVDLDVLDGKNVD